MKTIKLRIVTSGGIAAAATLLLANGAFALNATPISVTGYNQDIVVEVGGTYGGVGSLTGAMDNGANKLSGNTWYEVGQNAGALTTGLPSGTTFTSASDATTSFHLESAVGSNAFLLDNGQTGTLTFATPSFESALSVLTSTGGGSNVLSAVVHFADLSTQTITGIPSGDWFANTPIAVDANGRINSVGYDAVNSGNPRLYQEDITGVNTTSAINSVDFVVTSGGGHTAIMGLSGTAVPEPTTIATIAGGMAMLLGLRRRRA